MSRSRPAERTDESPFLAPPIWACPICGQKTYDADLSSPCTDSATTIYVGWLAAELDPEKEDDE